MAQMLSHMTQPILFTLDKGQTHHLNATGHSKLLISLKEGSQDYVLVVSAGGKKHTVSMENITESVHVPADSDVSFLLKEASTELSYAFVVAPE